MGWTEDQYREYLDKRNVVAEEPKAKRRKVTSEAEIARVCTQDRYRSKTEERYAAHLDLMKKAGQIDDWAYEPVTLKLAPGVRYTPDFMIRCTFNKEIRFEELKGRKGTGFYSLPVSKIKIKMAASLFPFWNFSVVWPAERLGEWDSLVIGGQ